MNAILGNSGTPADEADIALTAQTSDVQRVSDSADYTGTLVLTLLLRITDSANGPQGTSSGTLLDYAFGAPMSCAVTGGTAGSNCSMSSTVDALVPNFVKEGKRMIMDALEVAVKDAGPNGIVEPPGPLTCPPVCGDGDEKRFMWEGVFTP
jgi:hypothetical protein